jgi:hypothetical protein
MERRGIMTYFMRVATIFPLALLAQDPHAALLGSDADSSMRSLLDDFDCFLG